MLVTGAYLGFASGFYAFLTARVIKERVKAKVPLGDGTLEFVQQAAASDKLAELKFSDSKYWPLLAAIRAHANFAEFMPTLFLSVGLAESNGLPSVWVHAILASFLLGRVAHFATLVFKKHALGLGRTVGMSTTLIPMIGVGLWNIWRALK